MKRMLMALVALFFFAPPASSQELPSGTPQLDSLTQVFETRYLAIRENNPNISEDGFRHMTPTDPFKDHSGNTVYLKAGDFNGVWGWLFRNMYGEDYLTYRQRNRPQFGEGDPLPDPKGNPEPNTASALTMGDMGWLVVLVFLALLVWSWISRDRLKETLRGLESDVKALNKQNTELASEANTHRQIREELQSQLDQEEEERAFRMIKPLPIVREGDPIFEFCGLRLVNEERSPAQIANDLDRLVRMHYGHEYFVDHSTIEVGIGNGPVAMRHYNRTTGDTLQFINTHGETEDHLSVRYLENIPCYHAKARKGHREDAKVVDVYTTVACFNWCGEPLEGFVFTLIEVEPTNTELFMGPEATIMDAPRDRLQGGTIVGVEKVEDKTAVIVVTTDGGQVRLEISEITDESGHGMLFHENGQHPTDPSNRLLSTIH